MFFLDFLVNHVSSLYNMFNGWVYNPPGLYEQLMSNPKNR